MKSIFIALVALFSTITFAAESFKPIRIDIYGKQMGPKPEDIRRVRETIASFVKDLQVREYQLITTGIEGGFSACIMPVSETASTSIWMVIDRLPIDAKETFFNAKAVESCQ